MKEAFSWIRDLTFSPHALLRSGHAQTIYAACWGRMEIPYRAASTTLPTADGDQLVLHDDCPVTWQPGGICALLVHGLGGCHGSPYMVRIAHKLNQSGVRTFRMDQRGCGAGFGLARKPGHAGRSEDVDTAVQFVTQSCPDSPLIVVGFSLGGNLVLKMLGEWGAHAPQQVIRAMAVAPPINLMACSQNMERPGMRIYNRWFVRCLLQQTSQRRKLVPEIADLDLARPPRTLLEFDDRVTAPLSGFANASEYYRLNSSAGMLGSIRVPTLILSSADDPIIPVQMFEQVPRSKGLCLHTTRHGGHVGFIGRGRPDPDRYWLDWRVVEFVVGAKC